VIENSGEKATNNAEESKNPLDIQWLMCGDGSIEFELSKLLMGEQQSSNQHIRSQFANALNFISCMLDANSNTDYEKVDKETRNVVVQSSDDVNTKIYKFYCEKVNCIVLTMQITMDKLK
jgi:chaperonin GroEL (HSP60 family)